MTTLGITGGIGSGKSTVTQALRARGAVVVDADLIAREIMEPPSQVLSQVAERFGEDVLNADGTLNRGLLAQRAFASKEETDALNAITHPEIHRRIRSQLDDARRANPGALVVLDHPLLIETGSTMLVDKVAVVVVDPAERVRRLVQHRGFTPDDARARISRQLSDEQRLEYADFTIDNNGSVEQLLAQAMKLLEKLSSADNS